MLDNVTKETLRKMLKKDPAERDRFLANTSKYLEELNVSVPESAIRQPARRRGPDPVPVLVGGVA
jgi:hypothetical protein